ncbi:MAG: anti-sigma-factor [Betaproteobacteria bacterium RBG_16_56_24]|nr:MAG: anti-sigma-factor [Betaproteobacteria bacterium RBG_16_56_24]
MTEREGVKMVMQGNLDMDTVPVLYATGLKHLAGADLHVDFSRVEAVDSAAVSMLLGWARTAQRGQRELRVAGLPDDLLSLARLYGVDELLPRQSE